MPPFPRQRVTSVAYGLPDGIVTSAPCPGSQVNVRWDESANNRSMVAGTASLLLNAIPITRTAETKQLPIGEQIWLAKAPQGP